MKFIQALLTIFILLQFTACAHNSSSINRYAASADKKTCENEVKIVGTSLVERLYGKDFSRYEATLDNPSGNKFDVNVVTDLEDGKFVANVSIEIDNHTNCQIKSIDFPDSKSKKNSKSKKKASKKCLMKVKTIGTSLVERLYGNNIFRYDSTVNKLSNNKFDVNVVTDLEDGKFVANARISIDGRKSCNISSIELQ